MTKNNKEFSEFLNDEVNLNQSRIDKLTSGVRGVNGCLKANLKGHQKMERQGSYALGTIIKELVSNVVEIASRWPSSSSGDGLLDAHRQLG